MRTKLFILSALLAASSVAAEKPGSSQKNSGDIGVGTVLPRIAQGAGWATEIQVINTNDEGKAMPYTIEFFDTGGQPLTVTGSGPGVSGNFTVLAGVVPYRGIHIFTLPNVGSLRAGYGSIEVSDFRGVMVNSVLTQAVPGRPDFQMTIPSLYQYGDHMRMAFRNSRPYTAAIAITSATAQNWTFRAFDPNGIALCEFTGSMKRDEHLAFALSSLLSCTGGRDGLLEIEASSLGGTVVGIVAHDAGPFTVQLPYEICCVP